MAMVRWDPFSEMMNVQRDMNRLFSSLGMPLYGSKGQGEGGRVEWTPSIDVVKIGDDLHVRAELPGVRPEDIEVDVTGDVLSVRGQRSEESEYAEGEYLRKEFSYGTFERQVMLPQGIEASAIRADYHEGVLDVVVPGAARTAKQRAQRIPITSAGGTSRQESGARSRLKEPREVPGESRAERSGGERQIPVTGEEEGTRRP